MDEHIELSRRFRTHSEHESSEVDFFWPYDHPRFGFGWEEILTCPRVVILAEAGSGKTYELRARAKELVANGKAAFFIPIEALATRNIDELLRGGRQLFDEWKAQRLGTVWFFLDAVDELKLDRKNLSDALGRLAAYLGADAERAHIVVSCRPSDWMARLDADSILETFPVPVPKLPFPSPDDEFVAVLRRRTTSDSSRATKSKPLSETLDASQLCTAVLLPMTRSQVERFAAAVGVQDKDGFLNELSRRNAWTFARRPLDLRELVGIWNDKRRLGSRSEQHEWNVGVRLREDPTRAERVELSEAKAELGARTIALALALTRQRSILIAERTRDASAERDCLDPALVLPDWTAKERRDLLRLAFFDPATYGRVRFHHRSVQEYLAARQLRSLREKGMTASAMLRLFFGDFCGERTTYPSMRPIAAWLSLWDSDLRSQLTKCAPEVLLSNGDPEGLDISTRAALLRAFAASYGQGGTRGLNIPSDDVQRLAHRDLEPTIRELWNERHENEDVRELLLEVIWHGRLVGCADIASAAALDEKEPGSNRVAAVKALLSAQGPEAGDVVSALLQAHQTLPDELLADLLPELYPAHVDIEQLATVLRALPRYGERRERIVASLGYLAKRVDVSHPTTNQLRDFLAEEIWSTREESDGFYHLRSANGDFSEALAALVLRQVTSGVADRVAVRAACIATHFGHDSSHRVKEDLVTTFKPGSSFRPDAFLCELELIGQVKGDRAGDPWEAFVRVQSAVLRGFAAGDWAWLLAALATCTERTNRGVITYALLNAWRLGGHDPSALLAMEDATKDDAELAKIVAQGSSPPDPNSEFQRMQRQHEARERKHAEREDARLREWQSWRSNLLRDPAAAFSEQNVTKTLWNLYKWLRAKAEEGHSKHSVWNGAAIRAAFSSDVETHAMAAFATMWRAEDPTPWSALPRADRNTYTDHDLMALTAVSADASRPEWVASLNETDRGKAIIYAMSEINGFPSWLESLAVECPEETEIVVGAEVDAELSEAAETDHLPTIAHLSHAPSALQKLLTPRAFRALRCWPRAQPGSAERLGRHLRTVLDLIEQNGVETMRSEAASECEARLAAEPEGLLALEWLRALFRLDAALGAAALANFLNHPANQGRGVETFARLFGRRGESRLGIGATADRTTILAGLVRLGFEHVKRADDVRHHGLFTPGVRDEAQSGRDYLLSLLFDAKGGQAMELLRELSDHDEIAEVRDRMIYLIREKAAVDGEHAPYAADDCVSLVTRNELPPHDRDTLFALMMDRLEDLAHEFTHHEFTDRTAVRAINDETLMARTLALRLQKNARSAYTVDRESEVADQKRNDIRLSTVRGGHRASIEVKLAQKWSTADLAHALQHQLVQQYLRHADTRAGCLLLTYGGGKDHWKHPDTNARMTFADVAQYLSEQARTLAREHGFTIRLAVFALQLSDPPLVPAHR